MIESKDKEIAVVAVGNPLRGDDGIASELCKSLPSELLHTVKVVDLGPYTNLIYEAIKDCSVVVIVDAIRLTDAAASPLMLPLDKATKQVRCNSSHGFSFVDELNLRFVGAMKKPALYLFGVAVTGDDESFEISEGLRAKLPQLRQELALFVQGLLSHA